MGSVPTVAGGKDILAISAGAGAAVGVTEVGAITCVADADAAVADADPSSDCDAALSWSGMLKGLICGMPPVRRPQHNLIPVLSHHLIWLLPKR